MFTVTESPPLVNFLHDAKRKSATEYGAPCPFCGGVDRFIVFVNSNRGWCRQCSWKGDAIQLLRDLHGLSFLEAKRRLGLDTSTLPPARRTAIAAHSYALAQAKAGYRDWQKEKFFSLMEQKATLEQEKAVAEIAYRRIHAQPEPSSHDVYHFWVRTLASLYDRLACIETDLDLLVQRESQSWRVAWWQEEVRRG